MYTKTTAACSSHCNGKIHYPKTLGPRLPFPLPKWTSHWNTHPNPHSSSIHLSEMHCSPLTSQSKVEMCLWKMRGTDARGTSANPRLNSDHSSQHHSFFRSLAINVAWNCCVFSVQWNKLATVKIDTDILHSNDWQASWLASWPHFSWTRVSGCFFFVMMMTATDPL